MSLVGAIHRRVARVAVSPSAVRGQGKGTAKLAREFLGELDLTPFSDIRPEVFRSQLDIATRKLQHVLPEGRPTFGISRKLLNIFLRDALYNHYLRKRYSLGNAEYLLELPLDSITGWQLRSQCTGALRPPRWKSVKDLSPELSDAYQDAADSLAQEHELARVHLDAYWWGARAGVDG